MASAKVPPGPPGQFLVGNGLQYLRDPLGFLTKCVREYGDVVYFRFGGRRYYLFNHPDAIEVILRSNHRNFVKDWLTHRLRSLTGEGLIVSEGDFWRRQRQLAQPSFQRERIQQYAATMVEYTEDALRGWGDGQTRDVHHDMMDLALRIVAKTLFESAADRYGQEVGAAMEDAATYFLSPFYLMPLLSWIPTPTRRRYRRAVRRLDQIIYEIIAARRAQPGDGEDLLGRLLTTGDETGAVMTDQQLRDELLTLFLAGHETTALTLSFAFYLLSVNPAAAARLTAELDEVLGSRSPTAADVPRLRYAGWVIHESMRLYPPAWSIGREAVADCEIGGYPVPKGTQLALVQWLVHRDARWFEDPDAFRPERWDKDLVRRLPRCAYFPFGDGPRVCIGNHFALLEATLLLATVLQRFQLEMAPGATLRLVPSMTLRPAGGLRMVVRERAYR